MKIKSQKRSFGRLVILFIIISMVFTNLPIPSTNQAIAADFSYPVQEFRFGIGDTNRNISNLGGSVSSSLLEGTRNEKWYLNYVSAGVYEIVNSQNDYVLTNSNGTCTLSANTHSANQRWQILGVEKDFEGYYLYYKIVSNADVNSAVTFDPDSNSVKMSSYNGNIYQKFKLNLDGLEGFAANAKVSGGEKAGTIGGLLGETVFVNTVADMVSAMDSTKPLTIVVTANLDFTSQDKTKSRIRDNKTIVGSYNAKRITNSQWRTNDFNGTPGDTPSDNIVIRNIDFLAKNERGRILFQIWSSRNIWVDHCNFYSEMGPDKDEVGKFIWINTPYDSYLDAQDNGRSPDYITISYNIFNNRYWTVAYGTQNSETSRCRTTLMYNKWVNCARRCPQVGNGTGHSYSSYFSNTSGTISHQIIGGDGSKMLSENCRFEGLTGSEISGGGGSTSPYRDSGSYTSTNASSTPTALNFKCSYSHNWNPSTENYGYSLVSAYNTSGTDTKDFCNAYAGCFNSYAKIKYITDSDLSKFVSKKYDCPFLKDIKVSNGKAGEVMDTVNKYMFKNVNSGLYLEVADGIAENGTNVQQGESAQTLANTWKLVDAGNGYYYIRSTLADGKTYFLDLDYGNPDNGTNIGIWQDTQSDAQLFKFVLNADGSYTIVTKVTKDASCLGVISNSTEIGANVIQWQCNDNDSQKWIAEKITIKDGVTLDENKCYMFKNVNSGMYLEVNGGTTENGTNVQQWGANGPASHNVWTLESVGNGYYRVFSAIGNAKTFALDVDGGKATDSTNIQIYENNGYSAQFFKFVDNEDGSYTIYTRASKDLSALSVLADSKSSGANIHQWTYIGATSQQWILEEVEYTLPIIIEKGDVNMDGEVLIADLIQLQKHILNQAILTSGQLSYADLNSDGVINAFDLVLLKQLIINGK